MPLLLRSEEHTSELQSPCNLVCRFCLDRKSTRLNSSHLVISYAVFCLKKKRTCLTVAANRCRTFSAARCMIRSASSAMRVECFFLKIRGDHYLIPFSLTHRFPN